MTKKFGLSSIIILGIISGYLFSRFYLPKLYKIDQIISNQEIDKTEIVSKTGLPKTFSIPKLNINTTIENVNLDQEGRMDVPKDANNVAWYERGPKPGEKGSAVIAGHLDSKTGPAIFWNLDKLIKGDIIEVEDENGNIYSFTVERKEIFNDDSFPIKLVFSTDDKTRLNLITCYGAYDNKTKNYNQREVIFSVLTP